MKLGTTGRILVAAFFATVGTGTLGFAQSKVAETAGKREDIEKLLRVTGSAQMGIQVMNQMIESMKTAMPQVPAEFWSEFQKEVDPDELTQLVVPVYDRYLTHDDVKQLIAFYETPAGKKLVSVQPSIVKDSMRAGETWGQQVARRVLSRLEEKGYKR